MAAPEPSAVPPATPPEPSAVPPATCRETPAGTRTDPIPYQYAVLRAVPRVERDERVNVGVIVYCQAADLLCCRWRLDETRLRTLDPDVDVEGLAAALAMVERICTAAEPDGPSTLPLGPRFGWLSAPRSTVLQPGPRHGGVSTDPAGEPARLLARYVG